MRKLAARVAVAGWRVGSNRTDPQHWQQWQQTAQGLFACQPSLCRAPCSRTPGGWQACRHERGHEQQEKICKEGVARGCTMQATTCLLLCF